MIIEPKVRGFICTTAHPQGCAAHVQQQIRLVQARGPLKRPLKNVLVLGASGGYGLASRIVSAFGAGAATYGVSFEKAPSAKRTASSGWYNNHAFDSAAAGAGLKATTIDADAFADDTRERVIADLKRDYGPIDLLVYSLASPVRKHPKTGELHRSAIKPLGEVLHIKTLNVDKGEVHEVDLEPATPEETENTVTVMGGEDWEYWIRALKAADLLAPGFRTLAYTYIGSELTWPIYWEGTLGKAKEDLDRAAAGLRPSLEAVGGDARVVTLKAVVSQASAAIPVVPLYASLLFRVMKDQDRHESIIEHIQRLFADEVDAEAWQKLDDVGRVRVDDWELAAAVQDEVKRRWPLVTTENLAELGDLPGFREDFLKIFGFGFDGVDYGADVDPMEPATLG
ncbi:MAG: enoyl-ACP reductase FabV [Pseudomonadota bacterium]